MRYADIQSALLTAWDGGGFGLTTYLPDRNEMPTTDHARITFLPAGNTAATMGDDAGVSKLQVRGAGEKLQVFRIGTRIAGLDIAHAESIQPLNDLELVLDGVGNTLRLGAVAQRGVVNGNPGHGDSSS